MRRQRRVVELRNNLYGIMMVRLVSGQEGPSSAAEFRIDYPTLVARCRPEVTKSADAQQLPRDKRRRG